MSVLSSKYARFKIPTDSVKQNHDIESTIDLLQKMVKKSLRLGRIKRNRKKNKRIFRKQLGCESGRITF